MTGASRCARLLALGTTLAGCYAGPAAPAPQERLPAQAPLAAPAPALAVWAHTPELERAAHAAAGRLLAATGLVVQVNAGELWSALPLFESSAVLEQGWWGFASVDGWIGIAPGVPAHALESVVLHELLHALGAEHLPDGATTADGVMAADSTAGTDQPRLSTADLELLCAVQHCTTFAPEQD